MLHPLEDAQKPGLHAARWGLTWGAWQVNVVAKRCAHPDCTVNPRFNYEGNTRGMYCSEHKLEGRPAPFLALPQTASRQCLSRQVVAQLLQAPEDCIRVCWPRHCLASLRLQLPSGPADCISRFPAI